ncbi:MAG: hypothetical protein N3E49_04350 [Bacteroidia bacterium]|nr:hypothetical protein [Bacteroidia bacterium]
MSLRVVWRGLLMVGFPVSWIWGDSYYTEMRKQGRWRIRGEGALWDSSWVLRRIQAVEVESPSEWIWAVCQTLHSERLFRSLRFSYTGKGEGRIQAQTWEPVARVRLALRQYYTDAQGHRLPFVRPLDLPLIEAPTWDSIALGTLLQHWQTYPLHHKLMSYIYKDSEGIWRAYLETSTETFTLGRTEHLAVGLRQLDIYLRYLTPIIGGHTCKVVLLHIPNQIVCQ